MTASLNSEAQKIINRQTAKVSIFGVLPTDQVSDGVDAYWSIEFQKTLTVYL